MAESEGWGERDAEGDAEPLELRRRRWRWRRLKLGRRVRRRRRRRRRWRRREGRRVSCEASHAAAPCQCSASPRRGLSPAHPVGCSAAGPPRSRAQAAVHCSSASSSAWAHMALQAAARPPACCLDPRSCLTRGLASSSATAASRSRGALASSTRVRQAARPPRLPFRKTYTPAGEKKRKTAESAGAVPPPVQAPLGTSTAVILQKIHRQQKHSG